MSKKPSAGRGLKVHEPSPEFRKILGYINGEPRLLSLLYDLNLLPEMVRDNSAGRQAMLACYFGYRVGKDTPTTARTASASGRGGSVMNCDELFGTDPLGGNAEMREGVGNEP